MMLTNSELNEDGTMLLSGASSQCQFSTEIFSYCVSRKTLALTYQKLTQKSLIKAMLDLFRFWKFSAD